MNSKFLIYFGLLVVILITLLADNCSGCGRRKDKRNVEKHPNKHGHIHRRARVVHRHKPPRKKSLILGRRHRLRHIRREHRGRHKHGHRFRRDLSPELIDVNSAERNQTKTLRRREFVRRRLRKFFTTHVNNDGKVRLVDGRAEYEGTVEIWHDDQWGNICDDEWDLREGEIVCKQLGFKDVHKVTYSGHFGHTRHKYWLDNLFCEGHEKNLTECRHDGWGKHDCDRGEAAGVECMKPTPTTLQPHFLAAFLKDEPKPIPKSLLKDTHQEEISLRLQGGRIKEEGRVEVKLPNTDSWGLICGDGWSLLEAMVVCRQLGLMYAQSAPSTGYFGGNSSQIMLSGVKCTGTEDTLDQCLHDDVKQVTCPGPELDTNIAGVTCVDKMADLVPDVNELMRSVVLEDKQLFFLQCAMEENCLASPAYAAQETGYGWHLQSRRLLRFTARIGNQGDAPFRPFLPKSHWQWHQCHMHYHSMEVFAHYDITDSEGNHVAEGHKASFCLEDNNCLPGIEPVFNCQNYGDQGISPGCTDTYAYNVDCQWIDITELKPGTYTFKVEINPEFKVAEQSFDNNAVVCELMYSTVHAWVGNCTLQRPGPRNNPVPVYTNPWPTPGVVMTLPPITTTETTNLSDSTTIPSVPPSFTTNYASAPLDFNHVLLPPATTTITAVIEDDLPLRDDDNEDSADINRVEHKFESLSPETTQLQHTQIYDQLQV